MDPRHLGVGVILVKCISRIHHTNLKIKRVLALTFANKDDYAKIHEDDKFDITGLTSFKEGQPLTIVVHHKDGSRMKSKPTTPTT
jgi:aconitate hydratase